jgi:hypothetical protein
MDKEGDQNATDLLTCVLIQREWLCSSCNQLQNVNTGIPRLTTNCRWDQNFIKKILIQAIVKCH